MYARLEIIELDNKGTKLADGKGIDKKGRLLIDVMKELQMHY